MYTWLTDKKAMEFKRELSSGLQAGDTLRRSKDNAACRKTVFIVIPAAPEAKPHLLTLKFFAPLKGMARGQGKKAAEAFSLSPNSPSPGRATTQMSNRKVWSGEALHKIKTQIQLHSSYTDLLTAGAPK